MTKKSDQDMTEPEFHAAMRKWWLRRTDGQFADAWSAYCGGWRPEETLELTDEEVAFVNRLTGFRLSTQSD